MLVLTHAVCDHPRLIPSFSHADVGCFVFVLCWYQVKLVQHWERWVDLRRHVYREGMLREDQLTPEAMVKAGRLQVKPFDL